MPLSPCEKRKLANFQVKLTQLLIAESRGELSPEQLAELRCVRDEANKVSVEPEYLAALKSAFSESEHYAISQIWQRVLRRTDSPSKK